MNGCAANVVRMHTAVPQHVDERRTASVGARRAPPTRRRTTAGSTTAASYNCRFNHRMTRLQYWALQGSIDRVRKALLRGAAIDGGVRSTTARVYASWHRHVAVVRELLDCGANANARDKKGGTTLHYHSMMLAWRVVRSTYRSGVVALVSRCGRQRVERSLRHAPG